MKATLSLEHIGADEHRPGSRPWVAEITGECAIYGWRREFLQPRVDYTDANHCGSRGVMFWYVLEAGHIYEVMARQTWRRRDRRFCAVTDEGAIMDLTIDAVRLWLGWDAQ